MWRTVAIFNRKRQKARSTYTPCHSERSREIYKNAVLTAFGGFLRFALRAPVEMTLLGLTSFGGFLRFGAYVPSVEMTLLGLDFVWGISPLRIHSYASVEMTCKPFVISTK